MGTSRWSGFWGLEKLGNEGERKDGGRSMGGGGGGWIGVLMSERCQKDVGLGTELRVGGERSEDTGPGEGAGRTVGRKAPWEVLGGVLGVRGLEMGGLRRGVQAVTRQG